jgi:hypothetical protein
VNAEEEEEYERPIWTTESITLQALLTEDNRASSNEMGPRLLRMPEGYASDALRCYMTGVMTGMEVLADPMKLDPEEVLKAIELVGDRLVEDMNGKICLHCVCEGELHIDDEDLSDAGNLN